MDIAWAGRGIAGTWNSSNSAGCAVVHAMPCKAKSQWCAHAGCACRPELWPARPDQAPALFDDPGFFDAMAARAAATGVLPDLLFFAFYFQPVAGLSPAPCILHMSMGYPASCQQPPYALALKASSYLHGGLQSAKDDVDTVRGVGRAHAACQ